MADSHLLVIDVGNTRAKFGVCTVSTAPPTLLMNTAVRIDEHDLPTALSNWLENIPGHPDAVIISGSNPPVRNHLTDDWPAGLPTPRVVAARSEIPIDIRLQQPETVGLDRLLTAFAARTMFAPQQPVIVVDSGTATTVNAVSSDGAFLGGAILPGLRLSARALHEYTARLPWLDTDSIAEQVSEVSVPVIGGDTQQAMTSGLVWGQLGAIRELRQRMTKSLMDESSSDVACIVTGGGGRQLADHLQPCTYVDSLALYGLALLHQDRVTT